MDDRNEIPKPESDEYGELTEYYQQQFAPVWRQYKTYLLISVPLAILLIVYIIVFGDRLGLNSQNRLLVYFMIAAAESIILWYFRHRRIRCPKCKSRVLYKFSIGTLQELRFWFTGKCPDCGTKIK